MRIKRIKLKNYKRFRDLTIELGDNPKRIVALVGPNGCGKSSVFDALLYVNNCFNMLGKTGEKGNSYHSLVKNNQMTMDNIDILFDEGKYVDVREKRYKEKTHNTIFSFRSSFRFNGELNVRDVKAVSDILNNDYGASTAADLDERIEENYRRLSIKYNNYLNEMDCKPSEAKSVIIGELNESIEKCLGLTIDNLGNIESGRGSFYFKKDDFDEPFEYNVLSSGEKEVVDIILDLYIRKDSFVNSIYIIDEPELHLNTKIQRTLLQEINKMVPNNCQIWIATHSIGFLRSMQDDFNNETQIIEFKEENKWASDSYVLRPIVKNRSNWIRIFETALDDLSGLLSPKRIIYCEGRYVPSIKGEEQGLDAIVYNIIFGERYSDTLFVSSGGNTELDKFSQIAVLVLSKALSNVEILVLKDRDIYSNCKATIEQRELYLSNHPTNHRVLKRFEIENYLYDKEVLGKFCHINNLTFNESDYEKYVTDINNQQVKDITGKIKKICSFEKSMSSKNFKIELARVIEPSMNVYKELEKVIFGNQAEC